MSGFFNKLKSALSKTSNKLSVGIESIFNKKKLDLDSLNELEELLISSDTGVKVAEQIVNLLKKKKFNREVTADEVKLELALTIAELMEKHDRKFQLNSGLNIILVCGVNGNGKSTSIGKLASFYAREGKKVAIAACDTFRAAAVEQLKIWAARVDVPIVQQGMGADPASVAYDTLQSAKAQGADVVIIDTAGRLHNKVNLMNELTKIKNVMKRCRCWKHFDFCHLPYASS